ncbi:hypothetical protein ACHAW5_010854 [Stephanodiscus triporus]|uniref:WW domain-containing protein n=1 Tax=Stephanodiscus triporus TaxID=2934178 RepID=A0ABD3MMG8_9STRA
MAAATRKRKSGRAPAKSKKAKAEEKEVEEVEEVVVKKEEEATATATAKKEEGEEEATTTTTTTKAIKEEGEGGGGENDGGEESAAVATDGADGEDARPATEEEEEDDGGADGVSDVAAAAAAAKDDDDDDDDDRRVEDSARPRKTRDDDDEGGAAKKVGKEEEGGVVSSSSSSSSSAGGTDAAVVVVVPAAERAEESSATTTPPPPTDDVSAVGPPPSSSSSSSAIAAMPVVAASSASSSASASANGGGGGEATADAPPLEERGAVSASYVGRVIGKGGEMIRDLQARSGCRIDVDQNVPSGAPRIVTYRGTRASIDFAKQLVSMLCTERGKEADLPLGRASTKSLHIPGNVIGKIIGRGGEMIRKLQNESGAKIQVDHSMGQDGNHRLVTITGNDDAIRRAEEMMMFLCANPAMDSAQALEMLIRDKALGAGGGGTGSYGVVGIGGGHMPQAALSPNQYGSSSSSLVGGGGIESEIFPCAKMFMGRIIGQRGVTINDLQKRSGCDIQTKQNVPAGQDCQVSIKGSRRGIEMAKQMLREIIDMGPNHPYAGGHGHMGGGMGGGGHQGYQQQQPYQQQLPYQDYQSQGRPHGLQPMIPQAAQYGGQFAYQQQQLYAPMQGGQYGMQPGGVHVPHVDASPWRAATAADGQVYYYNQITQETQWDRPAGM